jgi:hypothetical protein
MRKLLFFIFLSLAYLSAFADNYTVNLDDITITSDQKTIDLTTLSLAEFDFVTDIGTNNASGQVKDSPGTIYGVLVNYKDVEGGGQIQFIDSLTGYGSAIITIIFQNSTGSTLIPLGPSGEPFYSGIYCNILASSGDIVVYTLYK